MDAKHTSIIKQVAARMTAVGFPNDPYRGRPRLHVTLSETVEVWEIRDLNMDLENNSHGPNVYALVVNKGHVPIPAWHVVDFRLGDNIYGGPPKG